MRLDLNGGRLRESAGRPAYRLLCGALVAAPFVVLSGLDPMPAASSPSAGMPATVEVPAGPAHNAVLAAWRANLVAYERAKLTQELASHFEIALDLADRIHMAAVAEAIDPLIAFSLVMTESSFRPRAVSPVGAVGLTQLLPSTADWLVPGTGMPDLFDPDTNLRVGFRYLRQLIDRYGGDERLALTAYNRGPGTVNRLLRRGYDPDNGYAERVLAQTAELGAPVLESVDRRES